MASIASRFHNDANQNRGGYDKTVDNPQAHGIHAGLNRGSEPGYAQGGPQPYGTGMGHVDQGQNRSPEPGYAQGGPKPYDDNGTGPVGQGQGQNLGQMGSGGNDPGFANTTGTHHDHNDAHMHGDTAGSNPNHPSHVDTDAYRQGGAGTGTGTGGTGKATGGGGGPGTNTGTGAGAPPVPGPIDTTYTMAGGQPDVGSGQGYDTGRNTGPSGAGAGVTGPPSLQHPTATAGAGGQGGQGYSDTSTGAGNPNRPLGGSKFAGKMETVLGDVLGSNDLKQRGLEKQQESKALRSQAAELNIAEQHEQEALRRRERAVGQGAHPDHGHLGGLNTNRQQGGPVGGAGGGVGGPTGNY